MNKLFLFMCLAGGLSLQAQFQAYPVADHHGTARKVSDDQVPAAVRLSFYNRVSGLIPSWTMDSTLYMAAYTDSVRLGHIYTFNDDGSLVSSQVQQDDTGFPAPIEKFHDEYYPHEKYTVWRITDASGNSMYYFTRDKKTLWFDPNGNLIELSRNKKVKPGN